jgi:hypothetical protein
MGTAVISSIFSQNDQRTQMAARWTATQSAAQSNPRDGSGVPASTTFSVDGPKRDLTAGGISSTLSGNTLLTLMQLGNKARAKLNVSEDEDEHALLTTVAARESAAPLLRGM